jgi:predicted RNase H-like nuclease (RuvC/YqgF family)
MQKISSKDAAALLKQAGSGIRTLVKENQDLREKLAARDQEERIQKLAREMEEKGLSQDLSLEEKVASLRKAEDLEVTEKAVKLAAPQGRMFGSLDDQPSGNGLSSFEQFIITGESSAE